MALLAAPPTWRIPDLEPGVLVRHDVRGKPDVLIAFVRSRADLRQTYPRLLKVLKPDGSFWVVWPRKAGGHVSDVTEQSLREELLPTGVVDTKVAALDDDWSGLRFVWRREHRPAVARRSLRQ